MKKNVRVALLVYLAMTIGAVAAFATASQSTQRYIVHLGKQVPFLPYRYFI